MSAKLLIILLVTTAMAAAQAPPRSVLWAWEYPHNLKFLMKNHPQVGVAFLSRTIIFDEKQKVKSRDLAPNYLVPTVITFAKAHPNDPRMPEALALSVKATRFSCSDDKTSGYSKAAFTLLHEKYPKSEWAKKTKYYY